jgi:phospholipase C
MPRNFYRCGLLAITAAALWLSGCSGNTGPGNPSAALPFVQRPKYEKKISHVVIIIQENRSFDNLFQGYPGANTQSYGYNTKGQVITLQPVGLETKWDLPHTEHTFMLSCNGTGSFPGTDCQMNGFDGEGWGCGGSSDPCPNQNPPYSYVPQSETAPYFSMAQQYVLADEMFASNLDESSFVAHQYLIAAQASDSVNYPLSRWGCEGGSGDTIDTFTQSRTIGSPEVACFNNNTLGAELDAAKLSWKFYASPINGDQGIWSAYQAIQPIYEGPDWAKDVISPQKRFLTDVAHKLAAVTWIVPTCANSDHAGCGSNTGPSWVTSLVNAIGESKFWPTTAIFIVWDDPGGWYDHVAPTMLDYDGLGFRIPMLIISPYAKQGYVTHNQYELGSILKFIENRWSLAPLSASDTRANSPETDAFDFSQTPRTFVPIQAPHDKNFFLHQPPDLRPPDSE